MERIKSAQALGEAGANQLTAYFIIGDFRTMTSNSAAKMVPSHSVMAWAGRG